MGDLSKLPIGTKLYTATTIRTLIAQAVEREREALLQRLDEAEKALQWRPIETAPMDGSFFLCWVMAVRYGETDEGQQYQEDVSQADFCHWQSHDDAPNGGWFEPCCGQIGDGQDVTHWLPLPPAPKG